MVTLQDASLSENIFAVVSRAKSSGHVRNVVEKSEFDHDWRVATLISELALITSELR